MPLTDVACKNAKCPPEKARARFTDSGGLYLEVTPAGGKHWRWKFRFDGKEKRLAIGSYPAITLGEARAAREKARLVLKGGTDPVGAKREAKAAARERRDNTFKAVAMEWLEHWKGDKTPRWTEGVKRRLEADVYPEIGRMPIADITAPKLVAMVKKIEQRDALDTAKRALQWCGQIMRFAVAHGLLDRNPAADVKPADALKPRKRKNFARLDAKDVPELLRKIQAYEGSPYTRMAMQLLALTFVRTSELIGATWGEIDLDAAEWRIPAERMKMDAPHIVPLSKQAVEVLRGLHEIRGLSDSVFPNRRDHEEAMHSNTMLAALYRMGYKGRMTGHGFRGVASTILHEQGYRHDVIELQLAHQERDAVSAAYNWATYLKERRELMQAWADHLDQLRQGAKVIPLRAA